MNGSPSSSSSTSSSKTTPKKDSEGFVIPEKPSSKKSTRSSELVLFNREKQVSPEKSLRRRNSFSGRNAPFGPNQLVLRQYNQYNSVEPHQSKKPSLHGAIIKTDAVNIVQEGATFNYTVNHHHYGNSQGVTMLKDKPEPEVAKQSNKKCAFLKSLLHPSLLITVTAGAFLYFNDLNKWSAFKNAVTFLAERGWVPTEYNYAPIDAVATIYTRWAAKVTFYISLVIMLARLFIGIITAIPTMLRSMIGMMMGFKQQEA